MPTLVGPNTFGEENLVFGYDLGDVKNSYKGEPAYNRHDYDKSVMSQTGFDNWSCYDGNYTASYHTWNIAQSKTLTNIPGPDGKYTNAMLYYNFDGGFYGPTDWGGVPAAICTTGNKITLQAWVKAADAGSIEKTVTPYMYFSLNAGGAEATSTNYTLTADWQLVSHTHTMSANATNSNNILYFFTQNSGAVRMYLTKTAVLSGTGHAVQWLPGGQTRSVTQGLIDLTGNSTIDLTDVSFDSNAQMTFDGTNDSAPIGTVGNYSDNITCEAIFRTTSGATWKNIISGGCGDIIFTVNGNVLNFGAQCNSPIPHANYSTTVVNTGAWFHAVATYNGAQVKIYINGILENTYTRSGTFTPGVLRVGSNNAGSSEFFNGDLPLVKVYNRALTATEVASNYKAIKGRFNI